MPRLLILLLLLLPADLTAQVVWVGGGVSAQAGAPATIRRDSGVVNTFGGSGAGRSLRLAMGPGIAAVVDLGGWGLGIDLALVYTSESFTSDPYDAPFFDTTTARDLTTRREFSLNVDALELEAVLRALYPWNGWELGAGGWVTPYRSFGRLELRERMITPTADSITYPDGTREQLVADAPVERRALRFGPLFTFGEVMDLSGSLRLSIRYIDARFDIGSLLDGGELTTSLSVGMAASLLFGPGIDDPPARVDPPPDTPASPDTPLRLALSMTALSADTSRALATPERERVRSIVPWPMVTGFAPGSAALPSLFARRSWGRGGRLRMGSLAERSPDTIAAHALDILRLRADDHPDATIRVIGRAREESGLRLARRRAESVRRYLVETGIAPGRVTVDALAAEDEEGVELRSDQDEMTAPIVVEWIVVRLRSPIVAIRPEVSPSGRAARWRLRVERDSRELLFRTGEGAPPAGGWRERLPLYNMLASPPLPPLEAALEVTDTAGVVVSGRTLIDVGVAEETDTAVHRRERITLYLPDRGERIAVTPDDRRRALALAGSLARPGEPVRSSAALRAELEPHLPAGTVIEEGSGEETGWRTVVIVLERGE